MFKYILTTYKVDSTAITIVITSYHLLQAYFVLDTESKVLE